MTPPRRLRKPGETVFGWLMLALGLFVSWQALGIGTWESPSAAGAFPLAAGLVMAGSAAAVALADRRRPAPAERGAAAFARRVLPRDVLAVAVLALLYMLALEPLGFVLSSFLFLAAGMGWLGRGRWLRAAAAAAVAVALVHAVFRLGFGVVLPPGALFR